MGPKAPTYSAPKKPAHGPPPKPAKPTYSPPKPTYKKPEPPKYEAPKKPAYKPPPPAPKKPAYSPPPKPAYNPPKKPAYNPPPKKPAPPKKQTYQNNAPVYVPAPKSFHKPPIIIYQGVAPPVHVYEKSTGGYGPVAQSRSDVGESEWKPNNGPPKDDIIASESKKVIKKVESKDKTTPEKLPVAQARSAQFETSSAVVGAKVTVQSSDKGLRKGTVEDIDPKQD